MLTSPKIWVVLSVTSLFSCSLEEEKSESVARVYDNYLTVEEVNDLLPNDISPEDSAMLVNQYINAWAKEQILVAKAQYNLGDKQEDLEELVTQYRKDLLKHRYEQLYINQHLDTSITNEEIVEYYEKNKSNFELKENILKAKFIVVNNQVSDLKELEKRFKKNKSEDEEWIFGFVSQFATQYNLVDTSWIRFNDLARQIPLQTNNQSDFLNRNKFVSFSDSLQTYFLLISEYKVEEDVSPLPYVKNTIKSIILNQRKLALLATMEEKLVEDAYEKRDFEIY